jgi:hypothetical protein
MQLYTCDDVKSSALENIPKKRYQNRGGENLKVKVNFTLEQARKAQRGCRSIDVLSV